MLMNWLAQAVCDLQDEGEDLVLATVLSKSGSAPCLAGAKMLVRADGSAIGSVGGGVLEAAAREKAARVFSSAGAEILSFDLTGADAAPAADQEQPVHVMRDISTLTLSVSRERMPDLQKRIAVFRGELLDLACREDDPRQVVQINIQAFPLTAAVDGPLCIPSKDQKKIRELVP